MKYFLMLLLLAPCAQAQSALPPVPVNIVCTVPTMGKPQVCRVEFWGALSGVSVETKNRIEAEKLVAILLENSGRDYVFSNEKRKFTSPPRTAK